MPPCRFRTLRVLVISIVFVLAVIYYMSRKLNSLDSPQQSIFSFSAWIQGQVLGISYQDRFCKHLTYNSSSKYPPVKAVAKQLNIKDGDTVFVNGLHCGEWIVALRAEFPKLKLFGVDQDPDSIKYVTELVPDGNFTTALPFELQAISFHDVRFDHAIIDGILSIYPADFQCKTVKQMIPMLKAGGSLYIGRNFESCEENKDLEKDLQDYLHVQLLPKCYWSSECLKKRPDIVEILYSKETNMFPELHEERKSAYSKMKQKLLFDFSSCATSIFIYRHIVLLHPNKDLKEKLLLESRHEKGIHSHECTVSEALNATKNKLFDKEGIRNAVRDMKLKGLDVN